jgi:two-component system NarL family sensor kinase
MTGPAAQPASWALLRAVLDLTAEVSDVGRLADRAAGLVGHAMQADAVFVFVLDDDARHLTLTGATAPFESAVGSVRLPLGSGVSGWVASHRTPVVLPTGKTEDPRWRSFPQLHAAEFTSMASVPMVTADGDVVGVVNLHSRARRDWGAADLELLQSTVRLVAGAVHTARLVRSLESRRTEQQQLSARLVAAAEQERVRLAGELHDGVAQALAAVSFHLSAARESLLDDAAGAGEQLARAAELLDLASQETRSAVRALRPPLLDDLGLDAALRTLAGEVPGVDLDLDVQLGPVRLHPDQETALYRIAQEALRNVARHAQARHVLLRVVREPQAVVLAVVDDGIGCRPDRAGDSHGLRSMADRARLLGAALEVTGRPGEGTAVRVAVPLPVG